MNRNKFRKITYICLVLVVIIVALILILITTKQDGKLDVIQTAKSENVRIINNRYLTQGDIVTFKIYDEEILSLINESRVEVVNTTGVKVSDAVIDGDEILVDTSFIMPGKYNIRIINSRDSIVVEDQFKVMLISL
ncbi:MAG: hypothetical protein IKK84_05665 [Clostridia bacterium]|nr:hypothetical protein [Clostridia bacterium]MBR6641004.1 hypothetical protein [Clostridia bacterium]